MRQVHRGVFSFSVMRSGKERRAVQLLAALLWDKVCCTYREIYINISKIARKATGY